MSASMTAEGEKRPLKRWLTPAIAVAAVTLAGFLLYRTLGKYSLDEIRDSIAAIPPTSIALAGLFAAASYLCLTGFDFLATRYAGHKLSYPYVALTSFTALSLGHNIGLAALSSGAIRYRFYSRRGVKLGDVGRIILFCGITVGIGLAVLGGAALLLRPDMASDITGLPRGAVLAIGAACLAAVGGYVALAAISRRTLTIWHWEVDLPPLRLALGQVVVGPLNFACVAACLHQALAGVGEVSYLAVAAVYVIAIVASLVTHVPGGLGVIEAVVLYLLPEGDFIGAVMAFRVVYFLVPLAIGGPLFLVSELILRRRQPARR